MEGLRSEKITKMRKDLTHRAQFLKKSPRTFDKENEIHEARIPDFRLLFKTD